eukprot:TRINITY_DN48508_c0_g1_i1.p1 TRINITY_DN48508_c0_g1~~TRINITY_DN48508_c0_g1_i1.p1  ORF type:complete len:340 (-),score=58.78 TRINITY_DN48508_c0_g1_i1:76-1095(-)
MSTLGDFRLASDGDSAKRCFVVANSDLAVEESSVSSDWVTESEGESKPTSNFDVQVCKPEEGVVLKGKKRRRRHWRVKHSLSKHRHLREGSSSSSETDSSSNSSTSSSSESKSDSDKPPDQRRSRNERRLASNVLDVELQSANPSSSILRWSKGSKRHRDIAFAFGFLNKGDILALARAAHHPTVTEIHDRKAYLAFKHRVVRFEMQLRSLEPALYAKLTALMRLADAEGWRRLRKKRRTVYPEFEYIEYDVNRENGECYIEPHVDNKSGVTLVAMLSEGHEYVGGNSCFRRSKGTEGHRQIRLDQGDVVMFRGEKLLHWITNVVSGRRVILQIELSRV